MQIAKFTSTKEENEIEISLSSIDKQFNLENEGIYKTIFHSLPLKIIHFDKYGQVIDCNHKLSEIIGITREILLTINLIKDLKNQEIIMQIKQTLISGSGFYDDDYHTINSSKITPIIVRFKELWE